MSIAGALLAERRPVVTLRGRGGYLGERVGTEEAHDLAPRITGCTHNGDLDLASVGFHRVS